MAVIYCQDAWSLNTFPHMSEYRFQIKKRMIRSPVEKWILFSDGFVLAEELRSDIYDWVCFLTTHGGYCGIIRHCSFLPPPCFQAKWIHSPLGALQAKVESKPPIICHVIELKAYACSSQVCQWFPFQWCTHSFPFQLKKKKKKGRSGAKIERHACVTRRREKITDVDLSLSPDLHCMNWIIQCVCAVLAAAVRAAVTQTLQWH